MLTILTGGTGGAKLVEGFAAETDPANLSLICNTADDCIVHGLHVSPDVDTITYTLSGISHPAQGWGIQGDTFAALEQLGRLGAPTWFRLGDKDLATHVFRTHALKEGLPLSRITARICQVLGVAAGVFPMSDDRVETRLLTPDGEISFQEYFVKERCSKEVVSIRFVGAEASRPAPGVIEAIQQASAIVICPSNPVTSIGPILAVPGIRAALAATPAPVVAVTPVIAASAITGPAHKLMAAAGLEPSAFGVAEAYADFLDTFLIAPEDRKIASRIETLGIKTVEADVLMRDRQDKRRLAREVMALAGK